MHVRNEKGFTLTELIVVMAIFITIIIVTATAFEKTVDQSAQQTKSAETQIAGIVGLEILRADLEKTGFGLPWDFSPAVTYSEASTENTETDDIRPSGKSVSTYNESTGNAPRAVQSDTTTFNAGSNYLVIKSTSIGTDAASKRWTTVSYDKDGIRTRKVWGLSDRDFASTDRVIIVRNALNTTPVTRQLIASSSTVFSGTFANFSSPASHQSGDTFEMYGISADTDVRFPFNS
ncbi:PilW family protein [Geotalea toluenoxydans]|uniref:PilW family protein n=1 Tax=Geotalea toluenoxydans TaxID=421624 RepID=UPI0006D14A6B|nr:prepilin-type N-terminal cleavage/methylation domain-containing protein [Geotalea toluenoxydans]